MSWRMKLQLNEQHSRLDKVSELVARAGISNPQAVNVGEKQLTRQDENPYSY